LNPPDQALVLCVDEKTQIQALDRTQPGLPMKKGRLGTMNHDYKPQRHDLSVRALEVLQGKVVGQSSVAIGIRSSEIPAPPRRGVSRRRGLALW